jgi:AraC family transcriptional regulator
LKPGTDIPGGFETFAIPAQTWAVFKCVGAMPKAIQDMWKRVYEEWLPNSDYELNSTYEIEMYTSGDTDSPDYVSEIWIPVKKK